MNQVPSRPIDALLADADWMRNFAFSLVHDTAQADDLVQRTYVAALECPPKPGPTYRSWVAGTMKNLRRRDYRSDQARKSREREHSREEAVIEPPEQYVIKFEIRGVLRRALGTLAEPYRSTLAAHWEGIDVAEIARRENCPKKTIESRLARGRALLCQLLDRECKGDRRVWVTALTPWLAPTKLAMPRRPHGTTPRLALVAGVLALLGSTVWFMKASPEAGERMSSAMKSTVSSGPHPSTTTLSAPADRSTRNPIAPREVASVAAPLAEMHSRPPRVVWDVPAIDGSDLGPRGLAVGSDHELFQVDYGAGVIRRFTPDGAQDGVSGQLGYMCGLAFQAPRLFASVPHRGVLALDGTTLAKLGEVVVPDSSGHWLLSAIRLDWRGNVHLLDMGSNTVHVFDEHLIPLAAWNTPAHTNTFWACNDGLMIVSSTEGGLSTLDFISLAEGYSNPIAKGLKTQLAETIEDICVTDRRVYLSTAEHGIYVCALPSRIEDAEAWNVVNWLPRGIGLVDGAAASMSGIAADASRNCVYIAYTRPFCRLVCISLEDAELDAAEQTERQALLGIRTISRSESPPSER